MDYGRLQKLYPEFKIPVKKHAEYYIDTLIKYMCVSFRTRDLFLDYVKNDNRSTNDLSKQIIEHFAPYTERLNNIDMTDIGKGYEQLEFSNYDPNRLYISIDLISANWQSFKHILKLDLPEKWNEYVESEFKFHKFISESKSFRQNIFGNTNPKRLQKIQQGMMLDILKVIPAEWKVVSRKSDELIIDYGAYDNTGHSMPKIGRYELARLIFDATGYDTRVSFFNMKVFPSYNSELVRVKERFNDYGYRTSQDFYGVSGTRFFMHLKKLYALELGAELDERDLLFEYDNYVAKFILD